MVAATVTAAIIAIAGSSFYLHLSNDLIPVTRRRWVGSEPEGPDLLYAVQEIWPLLFLDTFSVYCVV